MRLTLDPSSADDYATFLAIKQLPVYSFTGREASFPDEYASRLGLSRKRQRVVKYEPSPFLFDYQRDIAAMAIAKQRFAVFADCGLGKTLIFFEFMRHAMRCQPDKCGLLLSPLNVVSQTVDEYQRWYPNGPELEYVKSSALGDWIQQPGRMGITNYEALRDDVQQGALGCLACDESSILKSHYGEYGQQIIRLGRGIEWKLAGTGTPAPNDQIEYANHAVLLDHFPTINAFLARFFVNRGQTDNRWELKPHALEPFYNALSHWCIFLSNPAVYGWKDNSGTLPPINTHIHEIELTTEQSEIVTKQTGALFAHHVGGITSRSALARIAKGSHKGEDVPTLKYEFIRGLVDSWPDESTIIWCLYNDEQDRVAAMFPDCANIDGSTPHETRMALIADFKAGRRRVLVSKPKILGYGLNLQICTRQVFSGLQDSYESFYQAVKRSNRYGSTRPLNVHIPVTELERPMIETVLRKASRVQQDTEEQERIFRKWIQH